MQITNRYEDEITPLERLQRDLRFVSVEYVFPAYIRTLARRLVEDLHELRPLDRRFWNDATTVFECLRGYIIDVSGPVPAYIERDLTLMLKTFGERIADVTLRDFEAAIRTKHLAARLDRIATAYEAAMGEGRLVEAVEARWRQDGR
jgi:hypothetical protein